MNSTFARFRAIFLIVALAALAACNDPTELGGDLLEGDRFDVNAVDTLTLVASTVKGDSLRTYSSTPGQQLRGYLFGDFKDPVFGRTTASLYIEPRLRLSGNSFDPPDFRNSVLDSVVLVMPYDLSATYGFDATLMEQFGIAVHELTEAINAGTSYFADKTFAFDSAPLVEKDFTPTLDSVTVIRFVGSQPDTVRQRPQLRIQLPAAYGNRLLSADSLALQRDSTFLELFKGLHLRPTRMTESMLALSLFGDFNGEAGIFIYFNRDGNPRQYQFPMGLASARVANYVNDYTGAPVAPFIGNPTANDTINLVQGTVGLFTRIKIPHIRSLDGAAISRAVLEVPILPFAGDNGTRYPSTPQLVVSRYADDGRLTLIADVSNAADRLDIFFGGNVLPGSNGNPAVYRFNISNHIQRMVSGAVSDEIIIAVSPRGERVTRSILAGPNHPTTPIRLRVTFVNP